MADDLTAALEFMRSLKPRARCLRISRVLRMAAALSHEKHAKTQSEFQKMKG